MKINGFVNDFIIIGSNCLSMFRFEVKQILSIFTMYRLLSGTGWIL